MTSGGLAVLAVLLLVPTAVTAAAKKGIVLEPGKGTSCHLLQCNAAPLLTGGVCFLACFALQCCHYCS